MGGEDPLEHPVGRLADHDVGSHPPDHLGEVAPQRDGDFEPAVGVAEEA